MRGSERIPGYELIPYLRLEGKTIPEIMDIVGCSKATVCNYLKYFGLTINQSNWVRKTHVEDEATLARWAKAMNFE